MQNDRLDRVTLQKAGKRTGLEFSKLLAASVLEEIVRCISESDYAYNLWLRNGNIISREIYENNLTLKLEYDYVISNLSEESEGKSEEQLLSELAEDLQNRVFGEDTDYNVKFQVQWKKLKKRVELYIEGQIEAMRVPVCMKIHAVSNKRLIPKKETFHRFIFPDEQVTYYGFPAESLLAENFMEIITKLELIQDLRAYYEIYYLLMRGSVDGRKVRDYISEQCKSKNILKEKTYMDIVSGYRNYTYMKNRWKVFLRAIHSKSPDWETMIDCFTKFFEPIWEAVMEDTVFFGDWMPELNRFL